MTSRDPLSVETDPAEHAVTSGVRGDGCETAAPVRTWERGEARWSAKLTEADVFEIRRLYADGTSLKALHQAYPQCNKSNLHHIVNGRRWRYLLDTFPPAAGSTPAAPDPGPVHSHVPGVALGRGG